MSSFRTPCASRARRRAASPAAALAMLVASVPGAAAPVGDELEVALPLAGFLGAARTIVAGRQGAINDLDRTGPAIEGGEVVVASLALLDGAGSGVPAALGGPAGDLDITGYPKEGEEHGALGGAISVTLFR